MRETKYILLAEDNEHIAEMLLMALAEQDPANKVMVVHDGAEALDYLYRRGAFQARDNGNPVVLLLDLKMPKVDGLEVLRQIKNDERLRLIPVVMLTSSRDDSDLARSYQLGANAYVVKPIDFKQFMATIKQVGTFWTTINELPVACRSKTALAPPSTVSVAA